MLKSNYTNSVSDVNLKRIAKGTLDKTADILANTFGPFGATTIIDKYPEYPKFTKDGFTVLESLKFNGPIERNVLEMVKEMASSQVFRVGDGSTSTIIAASRIYDDITGIMRVFKDNDVAITSYQFINSLKNVRDMYTSKLIAMARPVTDDMSQLLDIAAISLNNDSELGELVYNAFKEVGLSGDVTFEKTNTRDVSVEIINGAKIDFGYIHDKGYNSKETLSMVLEDSDVIIFSHPIEGTNYTDLFIDIINYYICVKKPVTIIVHRLGDAAWGHIDRIWSSSFVENINIVNMPQNMGHSVNMAKDVAMCCGCSVLDKSLIKNIRFFENSFYNGGEVDRAKILSAKINEEFLPFIGKAGRVESTKTHTIIQDGYAIVNDSDAINEVIFNLESKLKIAQETPGNFNTGTVSELRNRIAVLKNKMAVINVGGPTDQERNATYDLIEDAVKACRSALKHGYTVGGNYAIPVAYSHLVPIGTMLDRHSDWSDTFKKLFNMLDLHPEYAGGKPEHIYVLESLFIIAINESFRSMIKLIYRNGFGQDLEDSIIDRGAIKCLAYNVVTGEYDSKVLNSANTEVEILSTAVSIISLLISSNQFLGSDMNATLAMYAHLEFDSCK
ncbi:MAG: TCP-1/cpn60 chaperonin family protein [Fusobacteriaceae bacterium]